MRYDNRMRGLKIIIYLTVIHALLILGYYILTLTGKLPNIFSGDLLKGFTFSDILFAVIPSLLAGLGMLKRKRWGWHSFILATGAYLHSMGMVLLGIIQKGKLELVSFVPLYLIAFLLISNLYLWSYRYVIDFD